MDAKTTTEAQGLPEVQKPEVEPEEIRVLHYIGSLSESKAAEVRKRLMAKIIKKDDAGCWIASGANVNGYLQFAISGLRSDGRVYGTTAHKASYMAFGGVVARGFVVDHKCRNKHCINPDHLRALSQKDNILSGVSLAAINSRKKTCKRGHLLSGRNLAVTNWKGRISRQCRICRSMRQRLFVSRKKLNHAQASVGHPASGRTTPVECALRDPQNPDGCDTLPGLH